MIESTYVAQPNDAIFVNVHNENDRYVPADPDGSRWKFSQLREKGYDVIHGHPKTVSVLVDGKPDLRQVIIKSDQTFPVLREAVEQPTCIKDAWGSGQHQFLFTGATLKKNANGSVTGIDKSAFDATWETFSL